MFDDFPVVNYHSKSASSTGAKHLKYFLVQQQQQNQTIKNISSTSRLPDFYKKERCIVFHKFAHPSVSLLSCTGMSLKMIKTKKDIMDYSQGSSGGSDFDNVGISDSLEELSLLNGE